MCVYLRANFDVSTIITSFRQRERNNFTPHNSKRSPEKPTQIRVKQYVVTTAEYFRCRWTNYICNDIKYMRDEACLQKYFFQNFQ